MDGPARPGSREPLGGTLTIPQLLLLASTALSAAEPPTTGREIMARVNERPRGGDATMTMRVELVDPERGRHHRRIEVRRSDDAPGFRSVYSIVEPPRLEGLELLVIDGTEDDQMWMYFPLNDQLVRVVTRGLSALSTDFTCEDLKLTMPLEDFDFRVLSRSTSSEGVGVVDVELVPRTDRLKAELGYARAIGTVREDTWIITRAEYFDDKGALFKVFTGSDIRQHEGVWLIHHRTMTNLRAKAARAFSRSASACRWR